MREKAIQFLMMNIEKQGFYEDLETASYDQIWKAYEEIAKFSYVYLAGYCPDMTVKDAYEVVKELKNFFWGYLDKKRIDIAEC